jgi:hypothetical protein
MATTRRTRMVEADVFREVYDSPASLPGKQRWVTNDADVRAIEDLLGIEARTIGAPLWVSGDERTCPSCGREISWLDIVSSALTGVHASAMIAKVILGEQKFVNVELPGHIEGVRCHACGTAIEGIRSFKCHNWAYAIGDLKRIVEQLEHPRA